MSGIFDQIINYSPPLIVSGTVNYKGTWNASTNTPTLIDPPVASTKGDYYVVSTAGTQFSITFGVGDWIISNGTAWEKVDLTDAVSSVFGRTGAVVGVSTDYSAVGLTNTAIGASSPSTGAFTSLSSSSTTTLNGTTIPASKTLVVTTDKLSALAATTSAELAGVISDETGSGALVFANSPTLVTPALGTPSSGTVTNLTGTASININGTVGATTPTTGVFTGLTVNDNSTLGSSNSDTVNFNARVASSIDPATDNQYDLGRTGHEWRDLHIDGTANIDSLVADTADINGGTIDGTAIGATTPSTVAATSLSTSGNLTFTGTSNRITGDFSNATVANRVAFQTSTTNGNTSIFVLPNGTSTTSAARCFNNSDPTNAAFIGFDITNTESRVTSGITGTGTNLPITFYTGGSERARIDTAGNVGIGTASVESGFKLHVTGNGFFSQPSGTVGKVVVDNADQRLVLGAYFESGVGQYSFISSTNNAETGDLDLLLRTGTTERARISSTGLAVTGEVAPATLRFNRSGGAAWDSNGIRFQIDGATYSNIGMNDSSNLRMSSGLVVDGALSIGNTVAAAVAVASTHKVTIVIGGVTYYLLATNV
jgi:hypothetical protein